MIIVYVFFKWAGMQWFALVYVVALQVVVFFLFH